MANLTEYELLCGWIWDDHTIIQGCDDAEGHLCINCLIQGLPQSGHEKATRRSPAKGSRMTKSICFCDLRSTKALTMRPSVGRPSRWVRGSVRDSNAGLFRKTRVFLVLLLWLKNTLKLPYTARQSGTLPLNLSFLKFTFIMSWRLSQPFLAPSSCFLTNIFPNKILTSQCLLLGKYTLTSADAH